MLVFSVQFFQYCREESMSFGFLANLIHSLTQPGCDFQLGFLHAPSSSSCLQLLQVIKIAQWIITPTFLIAFPMKSFSLFFLASLTANLWSVVCLFQKLFTSKQFVYPPSPFYALAVSHPMMEGCIRFTPW